MCLAIHSDGAVRIVWPSPSIEETVDPGKRAASA